MAIKIPLFEKNNNLRENGYTIEEEAEVYERQLQDIIENTRWYLDNLEYLQEYRVRWKEYRKSKMPTIPHRFVEKSLA